MKERKILTLDPCRDAAHLCLLSLCFTAFMDPLNSLLAIPQPVWLNIHLDGHLNVQQDVHLQVHLNTCHLCFFFLFYNFLNNATL